MSKGSYPAADHRGQIVGHYVYEDGRGWVYHPLPKPVEWVDLGASS